MFPSFDPATSQYRNARTPLQFSLMLSSALDVFDLRARQNAASHVGLSGDLGLLHAVDDRLALYGFETNTGVRLICVVDMQGRRVPDSSPLARRPGLRDAELKPVWKAVQAAYVRLLQNPFYEPDEHTPPGGSGGKRIRSVAFNEAMDRIGRSWTQGAASL